MTEGTQSGRLIVPALIVRQWMDEWDEVRWDDKHHQAKPKNPYFYLFTLPAPKLRRLSGIYPRTADPEKPRAQDLGIQRYHDKRRSDEIAVFKEFGFPWSDLTDAKRKSDEFHDLRKPGWLPTSILVNILEEGEDRGGNPLDAQRTIQITDHEDGIMSSIALPDESVWRGDPPPIEVIDGQHRLWAFEEEETSDFHVPIVAFHGLDRSWQAYLFWTINIKPKRINASLAFDLYPLLRSEDWLEKFYGHAIYREARAQELVEALWSNPLSPWRNRINMLGEPGMRGKLVSQSAWVGSLMASFVKAWDGRSRVGGLFGAPVGKHELVLGWSRHEQAAVLIFIWRELQRAVAETPEDWARLVREAEAAETPAAESADGDAEVEEAPARDPAFASEYTLLSTDQGVRGFMQVMNDLLFLREEQLELERWRSGTEGDATDEEAVRLAVQNLENHDRIAPFVRSAAESLAGFDWRTSSFPGLDPEPRRLKSAYRGSGGYALLRQDLVMRAQGAPGDVGQAATDVRARLNF